MAEAPRIAIDDARYVKALAHPLRIRVLAMLQERPSSPVRIAHELSAPLGRVAHHVRVLRELQLIELVETRQRRGAIEHVYSARETPRFSDESWGRLGGAAKQRLLAAILGQIGAYVSGSAAGGGFDRADANLSRVPLRLDDRGWQELATATKRWLGEVDAIQDEVRTRGPGEQDLLDVGLVLLLFEAQPFSRRLDAGPG